MFHGYATRTTPKTRRASLLLGTVHFILLNLAVTLPLQGNQQAQIFWNVRAHYHPADALVYSSPATLSSLTPWNDIPLHMATSPSVPTTPGSQSKLPADVKADHG